MTTQPEPRNPATEAHEFDAAVPFYEPWLNPGGRPRLLRPLTWRILVTLIVLVILTVIGWLAGASILEAAPASHPQIRPQSAPLVQDAGSPLVMAFYYSWFDESTWTYDRLSDLPSEPYVSRDRGVMGRHIDQAKGAGIDALILAWYGPAGGHNQTEPNLSAMLDEAAARGFRIGILFEADGPFFGGVGDVTAALQHAQNTHFNHPAYLKVDGRPVVFFWRPTLYGVETWRTIRNQADPGYSSIWISEGVNTGYLDVFDGHHLYSNTWNPPADLHAVNQRYAGEVAAARDRLGAYKFWVATVMPGYDDVRIRGGGGFARDREGGAYYTRAWEAAIASNPNWVVINSFNEWPEGSYIEPSAAHGDHYLNLTGQYSGQFKSGGGVHVELAPPAPLAEPEPEPAPEPEPTPEPDTPTAFVETAILNLRAGPSVEFPVLTQLNQGAALPITGRHAGVEEWWQVEANGQTGWVHRDFVASGGPLEQVAALDDAGLPTLPAPDADVLAAEAGDNPGDDDELVAAAALDEHATDHAIAASPALEPETSAGEEESVFAASAVDTSLTVDPIDAELADAEPVIAASAGAALTDVTDVEHAGAESGEPPAGAEISWPGALDAVSAAIRGAVHPLYDPTQATLHPYLSP